MLFFLNNQNDVTIRFLVEKFNLFNLQIFKS